MRPPQACLFLMLQTLSSPSLFCPESGEVDRGAAMLTLQPTEALIQGDTEVPQEHGKTEKVPQ